MISKSPLVYSFQFLSYPPLSDNSPSANHNVSVRNTKGSTSETETARLTREALEFVGPIDRAYVKRFSAFGRSMVDPIVKLKSLERFIASILMEKYDICFDDSKDEKTEGRANPHHGVPSGVKGPSALAQYVDGAHEKPSPPPQEDLKDDSASSTENPGSNRNEHYNSKPSFPIDATTIPALALALPYLTINEPSRAPESSSALQGRSTLYDTKPDTAPQGTPQWKIDLSERKGHRIHLLHVGDSELGILAKCLSYLYNVTSKADECFDFIIKKRGLAKHMKKEYEQWAGACGYRKDTFTKASKGEKSTKKGGTRLEYNHGSDFDERKHRLSAKAPLSGSRYVPYTLDPDTAMGYGPYNDADANASGYRQLQIAAQSSFPSPDAQQQLRQGPSIIDLEDYDLDSESDSRSATPTPTDQSSSPAASSLFHASDISMDSPSDFRMASPSSSEDEGSQDSDRTVRRFSYSTYEGEGARRGLGSPVPFADYDDDDMDEGYDDDAGSEDSEITVGAGVGTLGAGGYATLGSASRGMSTPTSTIAAQNDEAANNVTDDSHNTKHDTEHPTHQPQKSLRDRNGRRVGVYGEEL